MPYHIFDEISVQLTRQFLTKHSIPKVRQPLYSSDVASCDIFYSLNLKDLMMWKQWNTM